MSTRVCAQSRDPSYSFSQGWHGRPFGSPVSSTQGRLNQQDSCRPCDTAVVALLATYSEGRSTRSALRASRTCDEAGIASALVPRLGLRSTLAAPSRLAASDHACSFSVRNVPMASSARADACKAPMLPGNP